MASFVGVSFLPTKEGALVYFQGIDPGAVASETGQFFHWQGYRLEEGHPFSGIYGKGSVAGRFFAGGFADRSKIQIRIEPENQYCRLTMAKAMSGAGGGILGYHKMGKEIERLRQALYGFFMTPPPPGAYAQPGPVPGQAPGPYPPRPMPPQAAPPQVMPQQAMPPQAIMPPQAMPPQAAPPQVMPQQAMPPQAIMPPQAMPPPGTTPGEIIYTVGRSVDMSICVEDPLVSGYQARLICVGDRWYIEDSGASTGTYVNGQPVVIRTAVGPTDQIGLGGHQVTLPQLMALRR